jgi:hypothetical protein
VGIKANAVNLSLVMRNIVAELGSCSIEQVFTAWQQRVPDSSLTIKELRHRLQVQAYRELLTISVTPEGERFSVGRAPKFVPVPVTNPAERKKEWAARLQRKRKEKRDAARAAAPPKVQPSVVKRAMTVAPVTAAPKVAQTVDEFVANGGTIEQLPGLRDVPRPQIPVRAW